ncbi:VOC family protein [Pseudoclavibacter sp. 13-3]|uniref:VOC family protein n=1 Tax=Pseudoclavibacter sp. 13-3 TaxID=2901228 RepID=UPI001E56A3E9|nr:VOC family protein [Pseudoclavibacter sp. 13-3]MCD7102089.1 VOC family protein [Pseudoclavibacter sp. 13-3]
MQTDEKTCIVPNLWFDGDAREAVDFYVDALPDCRVTDVSHYPLEGLPPFQEAMAGQELTIEFTVAGQRLVAVNAGAEFRPNPSISLMLNFDPGVDPQAHDRLRGVWAALSRDGTPLVPLGATPFSRCFGWLQDRYGVCWQLILTDPRGASRPFVLPSLRFAGPQRGHALQAIEYYVDVFRPRAEMAGLGTVIPYRSTSTEPTADATADGLLEFADFQICGQWLTAADDTGSAGFPFTEGVSLQVDCADQAEIDRLWELLSSSPEAEACGWCRDRFGVSWQIVPADIAELMLRPGAYARLLGMKKIVIDELLAP